MCSLFQESRDFFDPAIGARPNANKILVIITDKRSDSSESNVREAAELLEEDGIRIIAVALGRESSPDELETTTPDVIPAKETDGAKKTADTIMEKVLNGMLDTEYV